MMQISDILSILARQEAQRLRVADKLSLSMLAGDVGGLLLLYEYSQINSSYTMIADEVLDKLLITLKRPPFLSTFCNGLAGFVIALDALHHECVTEQENCTHNICNLTRENECGGTLNCGSSFSQDVQCCDTVLAPVCHNVTYLCQATANNCETEDYLCAGSAGCDPMEPVVTTLC